MHSDSAGVQDRTRNVPGTLTERTHMMRNRRQRNYRNRFDLWPSLVSVSDDTST